MLIRIGSECILEPIVKGIVDIALSLIKEEKERLYKDFETMVWIMYPLSFFVQLIFLCGGYVISGTFINTFLYDAVCGSLVFIFVCYGLIKPFCFIAEILIKKRNVYNDIIGSHYDNYGERKLFTDAQQRKGELFLCRAYVFICSVMLAVSYCFKFNHIDTIRSIFNIRIIFYYILLFVGFRFIRTWYDFLRLPLAQKKRLFKNSDFQSMYTIIFSESCFCVAIRKNSSAPKYYIFKSLKRPGRTQCKEYNNYMYIETFSNREDAIISLNEHSRRINPLRIFFWDISDKIEENCFLREDACRAYKRRDVEHVSDNYVCYEAYKYREENSKIQDNLFEESSVMIPKPFSDDYCFVKIENINESRLRCVYSDEPCYLNKWEYGIDDVLIARKDKVERIVHNN